MNSNLNILFTFLLLFFFLSGNSQTVIPIETADFAIVISVDDNQFPSMVYCGSKLNSETDYKRISKEFRQNDVHGGICNHPYTPAGTWNLAEPAIQLTHGDGNQSLELICIPNRSIVFLCNGTIRTCSRQ
ncbi:MAG: hypothetical protein JEZ14_07905 [Marinilabiliaceae bacterium]|nr:hypothetical protein [Marinilabiliaceae bacterium]